MTMRFVFYTMTLYALLCAEFYSCTKKYPHTAENTCYSERADVESAVQLWHPSTERICILFGYGYNDADFTAKMTAELEARYGSSADGGLILPLVFPDDFKKGGRTYASELVSMLDGENICGIILLGAPDGTHKAVARLQDSFGGTLPYPVFSFFSQDDVLAMEDSSDILIDKAQKAKIDGMVDNEDELTFVEEVPQILRTAVRIITLSDSPFEKNAALLETAKLLACGTKLERYVDSDTGLVSVNHFVLE